MVGLIYSFIRWWIGSGIFDRIAQLVIEMMSSTKTDDEKKQYVVEMAQTEFNTLKGRVIDLIINIVLIKVKGSE
jgi:hypothetical protein